MKIKVYRDDDTKWELVGNIDTETGKTDYGDEDLEKRVKNLTKRFNLDLTKKEDVEALAWALSGVYYRYTLEE